MPTFWPGPTFQWRNGDQVVTPAHNRGHGGQLRLGVRNLQDEVVLDYDLLRIAAQGVAGRIMRRAIVGEDLAVLAILLQARVAGRAMMATVDQAADADRVADLELGHRTADGRNVADDFVPGHAGVQRVGPLVAGLVQVGMADAAVGDVDLDVVRPRLAANNVERRQRRVSGVGAIGFYCHGVSPWV